MNSSKARKKKEKEKEKRQKNDVTSTHSHRHAHFYRFTWNIEHFFSFSFLFFCFFVKYVTTNIFYCIRTYMWPCHQFSHPTDFRGYFQQYCICVFSDFHLMRAVLNSHPNTNTHKKPMIHSHLHIECL